MSSYINTTEGLSAEMRTFYSDYLIDNAVPKLVHDQFGQKHPIPKNGGRTIQFRKYSPTRQGNDTPHRGRYSRRTEAQRHYC